MDSRNLHRRNPSSSVSALGGGTFRHRVLSPRIPQQSKLEDYGVPPPVPPKDDYGAYFGSSVAFRSRSRDTSTEIRKSSSFSETVLEAVPLTPRCGSKQEDKSRSDDGRDSRMSRASRLPELPLSNFFAPPLKLRSNSFAGIFDYFKNSGSKTRASDERSTLSGSYVAGLRDATVSSLKSIRSTRSPSSTSRISSLRLSNRSQTTTSTSLSSRTLASSRTYAFTSSIDSGRTYLFPGINTTDRFTHRWPKPASLRKLERRSTTRVKISSVDDFPLVTGDELSSGSFDVGLGFERVGKWRTHKWCLSLSVLSVLGYSIAGLVYTILTWYQTWEHADVMIVADGDVLILATLCTSLLLFAALVGLTGTLLNSRPLLAIYALLLWPAFISLLSIGYISYKRASFSLDRKLNMAWSKWYTDAGRAVIQDGLRCCGFSDPTHEAVYGPGFAGGCYPRTRRPGCKGPLLRFERENLNSLWRAVFAAVPLHMVNIIVAMLCANHVTKTFGRGLLPRGYRLRLADVKADAKNLLEHFVNEKDGVAKLPPLMAQTESGLGWSREDKVYAHGY